MQGGGRKENEIMIKLYGTRWQDNIPSYCDHIITDPPYSEHVHNHVAEQRESGPRTFHFIDLIAEDIVQDFLKISKRWVICFCAFEQFRDYQLASGNSYVRSGIWIKQDATPQFTGDRPAIAGEGIAIMHRAGRKIWNGGGRKALWLCNTEKKDRHHETQKPVELMVELINDFTSPGDLIWDPYMGSGTTAIACMRTGRDFIGHEIQQDYFNIASKRVEAEKSNVSLNSYLSGQIPLFKM